MKKLIEQVKAARKVNTPLIAITTADQWRTAEEVLAAMNGKEGTSPVPKLAWDAMRGLHAVNDEGTKALNTLGNPAEIAMKTGNPAAMLDLAQRLPAKTVVLFHNAHRFLDNPVVSTGIGVLRDQYKADKRTLVLLAPTLTLPIELQQDVVTFDEPMPDDEMLGKILADLYQGSKGCPDPTVEQRVQATAAARGLSAFLAEQTYAMSMSSAGLDVDACWDRKRTSINRTPGLKFNRNDLTFKDVRGLGQIEKFCRLVFNGKNAPRAVLRIDEIDKYLAGAGGGDLSGVSADALGVILRWMEDEGHTGFLALGPGGAGKSLVSKAIGGTFAVPTLEGDLGGVKGSLVGESERQIRQMLKIASGVAGGRVFVVATCNRMSAIPPELQRRFFGQWFFDLPSAEGRKDIWRLYLDKFKVEQADLLPDDTDWTGAEIFKCCSFAADHGISPEEASQFVIPVAKSNAGTLRELRELADGRFHSASEPGEYRMPRAPKATAAGRSFTVEG
jgi:hypothetical protein